MAYGFSEQHKNKNFAVFLLCVNNLYYQTYFQETLSGMLNKLEFIRTSQNKF